MSRAATPVLAAFVATWLLTACSTGSGDVPTSCQPGEIGTCKGAGDCPGTAVCQADGRDFGPCQCTSDAGNDAATD